MGVSPVPLARQAPLRKCMQCREVKREAMSSGRCQACYAANERKWQEQRARNGIAVDENIIGWMVTDTIPGINDYLLYFVRWIWKRWTKEKIVLAGYQPRSEPAERTPPQGGSAIAPPQGQSNIALLALMKEIEHRNEWDQAGLTARQAADALTAAFVHGRPSISDFIPGHQPKDEPLPPERWRIEPMECEVRYG